MVRCRAGFTAVLREANRGERSGDLLGKLKAEVRVTRQPRKRKAADALRILFVTWYEEFARKAITRPAHKPQAPMHWQMQSTWQSKHVA